MVLAAVKSLDSAAPDPRIAAAVGGDRRAAESLLAELLPRVRNLVRCLLRGDSIVDDVAQESLIAILRGLPTYRGEGSLKSWSDRVVARTTFAHIRRLRQDERSRAPEPVLETLAHPDALPEAFAARRELVRKLDQLPYDQRHALVLHHVMGMTVPEIATEVGAPEETIRSRLRLGKANLRKDEV
jgi:RNA polymerase sigma-70 factor (ECF subfamily)